MITFQEFINEKAERIKVKKEKYSWGTLIKVQAGHAFTFVLHPEMQDAILGLTDGESTTFTDETNKKIKVVRKGDQITLSNRDNKKATVSINELR